MSFKPLYDRVLIERIEEEITQSGLVIPDSAKEKQSRGKIMAIGSGKVVDGQVMPLHVKIGDTVVFSQYGGNDIKIDGTEFVVLREEDILGIEE
ncbi:MAG: co-chaperone GroES [Gammaproteobacteria bacterium]|nr:co-chaperone GroES [Gammaproteobacteria bacterium]MCP4474981.1 co-chaperone GroES [Gammaproteobacteria bacterium]